MVSPLYTKSFTIVEQNSAIVTKGNWAKILADILQKFPFVHHDLKGERCKVTSIVRVVRNIFAHQGAETQSDELWSDIDASFEYLNMHCYAARVLLTSLQDQPELRFFAETYLEYETDICMKSLASGLIKKPPFPLFWVVVFLSDKTIKESTFYFDSHGQPIYEGANVEGDEEHNLEGNKKNRRNAAGKPKNDPFFTRIIDAFQLPLSFTAIITYEGIFNGEMPSDLKDSTEVSSSDDLYRLNLDTSLTHLFYIKEWDIQVEYMTTHTKVVKKFCSSDSMRQILKFFQTEAEDPKLILLCDKTQTGNSNVLKIHLRSAADPPEEGEFVTKVDNFKSIGSLCKESSQLVAMNEIHLAEYLRRVEEKDQPRELRRMSDISTDEGEAFANLFGD